MLTQEEIRDLSAAGKDWPAIPTGCPDKARKAICQFRKGVLNGTIRRTPVTNNLHKAAVAAITEREKMRLQLIAGGIE